MRKLSTLLFLCSITFLGQAQDSLFTKQFVQEFASQKYFGRGYINNGQLKAANRIVSEFKSIGLKSFKEGYFQNFEHSVNTITKAELKINETSLKVGQDFIVYPFSLGISGQFKIVKANLKKDFGFFRKKRFRGKFLNITDNQLEHEKVFSFQEKYGSSGILVSIHKKLTASVSQKPKLYRAIQFHSDSIKENPKKIKVDITTDYIQNFTSQNVIAKVPGTENPDSFIVFTAHYDHLGMQGAALFSGANDNASGVAMLLNLAKFYKKNPLKYTVVFIGFGSEEIGLLGSKYFVENSMFELSKIKSLINLDLVGTGEEGATLVNGKDNKLAQKLIEINKQKSYLQSIELKANRSNSDHYFFVKHGVNAMFLYLKGGSQAYHDIYDTPEKLSFFAFDNLVRLLIDYSEQF